MHRNALTVIDLGFCIVIGAVVIALVHPSVRPSVRPSFSIFSRSAIIVDKMPTCQAHLTQIGRALKMYLADWDDTYPTNRNWLRYGKLGSVTDHVKLSPCMKNTSGQGCRFKYGINWVESLDIYFDKEFGKDFNPNSLWRCSLAENRGYKAESDTAAVSYVFNHNLAEKRQDVVKDAYRLMMVREMDRLVDAELRPVNDSTVLNTTVPKSAFLTSEDARLGKTEPDIHGPGSHILFADGHVVHCKSSDMANSPSFNSASMQWYILSGNRYIAITP